MATNDKYNHLLTQGTTIQNAYWEWQKTGLDLSYQLNSSCKKLIEAIFEVFQNSRNPELHALDHISIQDDNTFESVWLDDQGRPCCAAMIDDGAPMGWRLESLEMGLQWQLHELLQKELRLVLQGADDDQAS